MAFWKDSPGGLDVWVRATPKGGRDALDGVATLADGREVLKIRVRVAAEDGAATAAVGKVLAAAAGVATARVRLLSGATARVKLFHVDGDGEDVRTALAAALEAAGR